MADHLEPARYGFFRCGEVEPQGWLLNQLRIQADGLGGKLDEFWPDIRDSRWIGGDAEGWERVPYWLDGFIPLAFLLRDEALIARARRYIDGILARQEEDGWLCPVAPADRPTYDLWALFLVLKVLVVWHDATGDERVEPAVRRALQCLDRHIDSWTLFGWGQTRWFECLVAIFWLYDRTGERWLLDLAVKLRAQGFDWVAFYEDWPMEEPLAYGRWSQMSHVVNQGMMLKSGPLYARLSGRERDQRAAADMLAKLDRWHGMVTGMFTGDECLSGPSPVQGTELCAVVEVMYSLEWLLALTGEPAWADRLERIAFNALPATFSSDMEWHQYDQQVNQVECSVQEKPIFRTNGPEANLFGVEPNYGCCTANFHQGWPKLALSTFLRGEGEIAVMMLLPATLTTTVGGVPVTVAVQGDYPFRGSARIVVTAAQPVEFTLTLRLPGWPGDVAVRRNGQDVAAQAGALLSLSGPWQADELTVELDFTPVLHERANGLVALSRGPLVYALPIGERLVRQTKADATERPWLNNWEVFPTTPWNEGLLLNRNRLSEDVTFEERPVGDCPFSPDGAPVAARVRGRTVPWAMERGAAAPAPSDPAEGPAHALRLIPYGCTNLRMTELPLVGEE